MICYNPLYRNDLAPQKGIAMSLVDRNGCRVELARDPISPVIVRLAEWGKGNLKREQQVMMWLQRHLLGYTDVRIATAHGVDTRTVASQLARIESGVIQSMRDRV